MPGEPWAPTLADVARHIPRRTRDTRTPGKDQLLGVFTSSTTPTGDQAQTVLDEAVAAVLGAVGQLPASPPASDRLAVLARAAAAWQAAADIELAYPVRDADVQVARDLQARATASLAALRAALVGEGDDELVAVFPQWTTPQPATGGPIVLGPEYNARSIWWGDNDI